LDNLCSCKKNLDIVSRCPFRSRTCKFVMFAVNGERELIPVVIEFENDCNIIPMLFDPIVSSLRKSDSNSHVSFTLTRSIGVTYTIVSAMVSICV
jgi:hypothetical protein